MHYLDDIGFNFVGYGCTTCIGNSGPLPDSVSKAILKDKLAVSAILSGNRNFEGRIHPEVTHAFLASPPLVVIYALAGTMSIDPYSEPLCNDGKGNPVYLKDLWPSMGEIQAVMDKNIDPKMFSERYVLCMMAIKTGNNYPPLHPIYMNGIRNPPTSKILRILKE